MKYEHGRQHNSTGPGSNGPIVVMASTMYLVDVRGVTSMMTAHPGRHKCQSPASTQAPGHLAWRRDQTMGLAEHLRLPVCVEDPFWH